MPDGSRRPAIRPDPARSGGAETSFLAGLALEYFATDNVAIGGTFSYNRFGFDDAGMIEGLAELVPAADLEKLDADWTIPEFGVYVKYYFMPGKPTRAFVRAGAIFASQKLSGDVSGDFPIVGPVSGEGEATVDGGIGAQGAVAVVHRLNDRLGLFGEAAFTNVFNDGKNIDVKLPDPIPGMTLEGDGNTQYFAFKAGITILVNP